LKKNKAITYLIGFFAFLIPIIIHLNPPTDFDGGPMLAYNFGFFFPLATISLILSVIVLFRLKYFEGYLLPKVLLLLSILPSSALTVMIFFHILRISNEPETLDLEFHNQTIELKLSDSLEIKLHGYTKRTLGHIDEVIEEKIINIVPYIDGVYSFKDGGKLTSIVENQKIFYEVINDSLIVYSNKYDFVFFNSTRIPLPFRIVNLDSDEEKLKQLENKKLDKFLWK